MRIKLSNNKEFQTVLINASNRFFQNSNREVLEVSFIKGLYDFNELEQVFGNKENTAKIQIIDDTDINNEKVFVYDDYVLRVSMSLESVIVTPNTAEKPEVREDRIIITLAQLTYIEKQLQALGIQIN